MRLRNIIIAVLFLLLMPFCNSIAFAALENYMPIGQKAPVVGGTTQVVPKKPEAMPRVKTAAEKEAELEDAHPVAIFMARAVMLIGLAGFCLILVLCLFSDLSMGAEAVGMAFGSLLIAVGVARLICWVSGVPFSMIKV